MTAKISVNGAELTVKNLAWSGNDPLLVRYLNALAPLDGPDGSDPNPDHTAAVSAVSKLGGRIVSFSATESVKGRVY